MKISVKLSSKPSSGDQNLCCHFLKFCLKLKISCEICMRKNAFGFWDICGFRLVAATKKVQNGEENIFPEIAKTSGKNEQDENKTEMSFFKAKKAFAWAAHVRWWLSFSLFFSYLLL